MRERYRGRESKNSQDIAEKREREREREQAQASHFRLPQLRVDILSDAAVCLPEMNCFEVETALNASSNLQIWL